MSNPRDKQPKTGEPEESFFAAFIEGFRSGWYEAGQRHEDVKEFKHRRARHRRRARRHALHDASNTQPDDWLHRTRGELALRASHVEMCTADGVCDCDGTVELWRDVTAACFDADDNPVYSVGESFVQARALAANCKDCHWIQFYYLDRVRPGEQRHAGGGSADRRREDAAGTTSSFLASAAAAVGGMFDGVRDTLGFGEPAPDDSTGGAQFQEGDVVSCNGAYVPRQRWFLDVHYGRPQPVYDDGGMHNRADTELAIFDHPDTFDGFALHASPGLEDTARFQTYLVCGGRVSWKLQWDWRYRRVRPGVFEPRCENVRGGPAEAFDPALEVDGGAGGGERRWAVGFAAFDRDRGALSDPIEVEVERLVPQRREAEDDDAVRI